MQGEWQRTVGSRGDQPGQFDEPYGLALTPDEDFFLAADHRNSRVAVLRALDGAWVRQLTGPPGTLQYPFGVAVVPSTGEILVSDIDCHRVIRFRSFDNDTVVGTLGTGQGNGPTEFNFPFGLAVLDGVYCPVVCVYITGTHTFHFFSIVVITALDTFRLFVSACDGFSQEGPVVVVVDYDNHRLVLWRLGDGTVWKQLGSQGTEPGQFTLPRAVAVTSTGALVVTDEYRVQVLTVDGAVVCVLDPTAVVVVGRLGESLFCVTVCADTDEILVTDSSNDRVVALTWSPPFQVRLFSFYFSIFFSCFTFSCFE